MIYFAFLLEKEFTPPDAYLEIAGHTHTRLHPLSLIKKDIFRPVLAGQRD
jgi:hypothetical protein